MAPFGICWVQMTRGLGDEMSIRKSDSLGYPARMLCLKRDLVSHACNYSDQAVLVISSNPACSTLQFQGQGHEEGERGEILAKRFPSWIWWNGSVGKFSCLICKPGYLRSSLGISINVRGINRVHQVVLWLPDIQSPLHPIYTTHAPPPPPLIIIIIINTRF